MAGGFLYGPRFGIGGSGNTANPSGPDGFDKWLRDGGQYGRGSTPESAKADYLQKMEEARAAKAAAAAAASANTEAGLFGFELKQILIVGGIAVAGLVIFKANRGNKAW